MSDPTPVDPTPVDPTPVDPAPAPALTPTPTPTGWSFTMSGAYEGDPGQQESDLADALAFFVLGRGIHNSTFTFSDGSTLDIIEKAHGYV